MYFSKWKKRSKRLCTSCFHLCKTLKKIKYRDQKKKKQVNGGKVWRNMGALNYTKIFQEHFDGDSTLVYGILVVDTFLYAFVKTNKTVHQKE